MEKVYLCALRERYFVFHTLLTKKNLLIIMVDQNDFKQDYLL
jgi:hypothetical protein